MITAILKIAMLLLTLLAERGKTAPARLEKKEYEEYQEAMAKGDLTTVSVLVKRQLSRVLRAKGRNPQ